jgi:hypothetical protein
MRACMHCWMFLMSRSILRACMHAGTDCLQLSAHLCTLEEDGIICRAHYLQGD